MVIMEFAYTNTVIVCLFVFVFADGLRSYYFCGFLFTFFQL